MSAYSDGPGTGQLTDRAWQEDFYPEFAQQPRPGVAGS